MTWLELFNKIINESPVGSFFCFCFFCIAISSIGTTKIYRKSKDEDSDD
jgi:hypothetical protein